MPVGRRDTAFLASTTLLTKTWIPYRGVTAGGELRAASFKGLREAE
jgi:hypothetical protein